MEARIQITNGIELQAATGKSLLAAFREKQIFLPSGCGGRGACGMCRVKIIRGVSTPFSSSELHWLSEAERNDGFRLACQITVAGDVELEIPQRSTNIRQYEAQVVSIRNLTADVKEIRLRLLNPTEIHFKAGQFIQFVVPPYNSNRAEPIYRSYSIASDPAVAGEIEIEVKRHKDGISTTYLHDYLRPGDTATIIGPDGTMYLRDTTRDIVFIAGGSGMAPIRSMVLHMLHTGNRRKARFFFGVKSARDLILADEMREIEARLPNFQFVPALSEPETEDNWQGETGLITEVLDRHVSTGENIEAYLCGSPPMIAACLAMLHKKGVPKESIYYDRFV